MIAVIPYKQDYDECDTKGRIIRPKGLYVDYGVDTTTLQGVCLPSEEWYGFTARYCRLDTASQEYILKD